jgi:hypothetical protein
MIRDFKPEDEAKLKEVHEQSKFDYVFPRLEDPLFIVKKVADEGGVHQGIALKLEATVYIWVDHFWGEPESRWRSLQELIEEAKGAAWEKGLDTLTCVVPPEIADSFERRLKAIGMTRDRPWPKFSFDLIEYGKKFGEKEKMLENASNSKPDLLD